MEPTEHRSSAIGPSLDQNSLESLQFNEEIQHLMTLPPENANSFTALLELPAPQAVELLHHHHRSPESNGSATKLLTAKGDGHGLPHPHATPHHFNPGANLTFPSNISLIERAARFSVFAGINNTDNNHNDDDDDHNNNNNKISTKIDNNNNNNCSPETTGSVPSYSSGNLGKVKNEPAESDSNNNNPNSSQPLDIKTQNQNQKSAKRKEREKKVKEMKGKAATKKSKSGANDSSEDAEKLPYVHVRARRGQATDSHSLAERARREKINTRMKLLQELVPGCNKISGTALVLDEIINHVQSLQRQVELLSMRLAAVNPRIDFNLDSLLVAERSGSELDHPILPAQIYTSSNQNDSMSGSLIDCSFPGMVMPLMWPEFQAQGNGQQYQQQWHHFDGHHQPLLGGEEESHNFVTPENSLLSYDSSANSVTLRINQLKMEL